MTQKPLVDGVFVTFSTDQSERIDRIYGSLRHAARDCETWQTIGFVRWGRSTVEKLELDEDEEAGG